MTIRGQLSILYSTGPHAIRSLGSRHLKGVRVGPRGSRPMCWFFGGLYGGYTLPVTHPSGRIFIIFLFGFGFSSAPRPPSGTRGVPHLLSVGHRCNAHRWFGFHRLIRKQAEKRASRQTKFNSTLSKIPVRCSWYFLEGLGRSESVWCGICPARQICNYLLLPTKRPHPLPSPVVQPAAPERVQTPVPLPPLGQNHIHCNF